MKKRRDQQFMHLRRSFANSRQGVFCGMTTIAAVLFLSSCTTYRPLDQGASVPWAGALAAAKEESLDSNLHRVQQGDALSDIASRFNVSLSALASANNIAPPYVLYPGEILQIPEEVPWPEERPQIAQSVLAAPVPLVEAAPSSVRNPLVEQPQVQPIPLEVEGERYVVSEGDSIALIAVRHRLTLGELVAVNDIEPPYQIKPGQVLIIPAGEFASQPQEQSDRQTEANSASAKLPAPPLSAEGFIWPVDGDLIGSFEELGATGRSGGINIAARKGTPVRASENGVVAYTGDAVSGYGRILMLRHAEGYVTLYAHTDVILVDEGTMVRRGQVIAEVGDSGDVDESQLHFELRRGTELIDPTQVLAGLPGRQIGRLQ